MKDRIKHIMEEQHMSQQVFADFIGLSPATLSSIFNGRTRPTLNIVEAIKNKIPSISTDWLLMGVGDMYISPSTGDSTGSDPSQQSSVEPMLDFDQSVLNPSRTPISQGVYNTLLENNPQIMKIVDKEPRKVTEIRVYYDDQTYETFVPMKSK
jgi:transcriptional regulator with XRE-family HTH domain